MNYNGKVLLNTNFDLLCILSSSFFAFILCRAHLSMYENKVECMLWGHEHKNDCVI